MVKRAGFGLVEVIIAMTLIGIGVLSIAASAVYASDMLRRSEDMETAARIGAFLVDSLSFEGAASAGTRDIGRFRAVWSVDAGGDLQVDVRLRDSSGTGGTTIRAVTLPPLPLAPPDSTALR